MASFLFFLEVHYLCYSIFNPSGMILTVYISSGTWLILGGAGFLLLLTLLAYYNRFVGQKSKLKEALSGIDVQLQRRQDLMPRLEALAGTRAKEIANIRVMGRHAIDLQSPTQKAGQDAKFLDALHSAMAETRKSAEGSDRDALTQLESDLAEVEKTLHLARRYYNALVRDYNNLVEKMPSALIALLLGFKPAEFFGSSS
jgi:LemA protein